MFPMLSSWKRLGQMNKKRSKDIKKEECAMSAVARDYVYEVKVKKTDLKKEKVVSESLLAMCKKVASKYPKK